VFSVFLCQLPRIAALFGMELDPPMAK